MASLDPQALLANVTPASVPTTPAWRTDPTSKMSRGLKESRDTKSLKSSCIYELGRVSLNQELFQANLSGGLKQYVLPVRFFVLFLV